MRLMDTICNYLYTATNPDSRAGNTAAGDGGDRGRTRDGYCDGTGEIGGSRRSGTERTGDGSVGGAWGTGDG